MDAFEPEAPPAGDVAADGGGEEGGAGEAGATGDVSPVGSTPPADTDT